MIDKENVPYQSTGKLTLHPKKCIPKISRQFPEEFYSGEQQQHISNLNRTAVFSQIPLQLQHKQQLSRISVENKEGLEFTFFADPQEIIFPVISKNPPHPQGSLPNSAPTGIKSRKSTSHYYSNFNHPPKNRIKCSNEGIHNQYQIPNLKDDGKLQPSKNQIGANKNSFKENLNPNHQFSSGDNQYLVLPSKLNQNLLLTLKSSNEYQMSFCQPPHNTSNSLTQLSDNPYSIPNRFSKRTLSTTSDNSLLTRQKASLKESNLSQRTQLSSQSEYLISNNQSESIFPVRFPSKRESVQKIKLGYQDLRNSVTLEDEKITSRFSTLQNETIYEHKLPSIKESTIKVIRFPQSQPNLFKNTNQININNPAKDELLQEIPQDVLKQFMPKRIVNQQLQEQSQEPTWFFGKLAKPLLQASQETKQNQEIQLLSQRNIQSQQQLKQDILTHQPPQNIILKKPLKNDLQSALQKEEFIFKQNHKQSQNCIL